MLRRTPLPRRRKPLERYTPLRTVAQLVTRTPLRRVSVRRAAELAAAGKPVTASVPRPRHTGPSRLVVGKVWMRAHGRCEMPDCGRPADDPHHRYERGNGGTGPKSPAASWINLPSNILAACRPHNDWCSNGSPAEAEALGWIVRDATVAASRVPVLTCHSERRVLLADDGTWTAVEACEVGA